MTGEATENEPIDWRRPETYQPLLRLDRGGWAWEFLRRNPRYRQTPQSITTVTRRVFRSLPALCLIELSNAVDRVADWGLRFRGGT
jgi:hypothetical protein